MIFFLKSYFYIKVCNFLIKNKKIKVCQNGHLIAFFFFFYNSHLNYFSFFYDGHLLLILKEISINE